MKIRAVANGNVIDAEDGAAEQLIEAGIYVKAGAKEKLTAELTPPVPAPVPDAAKKSGSTAVSPMTTASLPKKRGRRLPG